MPTTVCELFETHSLELAGKYKWDNIDVADYYGLYIISLSDNPNENKNLLKKPIFNNVAIHKWIETANKITVDGEKPSVEIIKNRLTEFWLPDESILYIGKADKQKVDKRVGQFFTHKMGKKSPHKGGCWVKTLSNLSELNVYTIKIDNRAKIDETEKNLLKQFIFGVSAETLNILRDKNLPLPFGNLEYTKGDRKKHGISNQYVN